MLFNLFQYIFRNDLREIYKYMYESGYIDGRLAEKKATNDRFTKIIKGLS